ncbi:PglL family O-oligosaccharyltransferase [Serratia ureilytica]|uniref:PglL family O-oligosaccharyltransferase n=1 Tax=Serratia ureilytica TaxID=300181 RepID=UPI0018E70978|nr:O-antigen ligase family protein [Serratia ureilytica]MBJ2078375.1 O-antigen ligase C-terminal domain-containing protein [Serratia ureilytica]
MVISINIFMILALFLALSLFWCRRAISPRSLVITPAFCLLLTGALILTLPLAWATGYRFLNAAWRLAALAGGLAVLFTALQITWRRQRVMGVLYSLVACTVVQLVIAGQQLLMREAAWLPLYGRRAYGTFFQPNVLASFLATGLAVTLILLLLPVFTAHHERTERRRRNGLRLLLALTALMLVWIQSRTGALGALGASVLLLWRFGARDRQTGFTAGALVAGALFGILTLHWGPASMLTIEHTHSNLARWDMVRDTLSMIAVHPWFGWGYGGFEYDFQHFRVHQVPPTVVTEIVRHPHNEALLWIVEGGLVGLAGLIPVAVGGALVVRQALRHDRPGAERPLTGLPTALCIALLPIALHTQLEFPFYVSAAHVTLFVLLFAMADRLGAPDRPDTGARHRGLYAGLALLCLGGAVGASYGVKGNQVLTQVEQFGMEDISPLVALPPFSRALHQERVRFDEQVNALLTYNHTRDATLLARYQDWAQGYLYRRIDKNVYATLIQILQHQRQLALAEQYRQEAQRFFPQDARFFSPHNDHREMP